MTILSLLAMLLVAAVVIYGVRLAFDGNWKQLAITIVVLFLAIWILGAFGVVLPTIGR